VKYFFLPLILILTSCSLDKDSAYWNDNLIKIPVENKKVSNIINKSSNFELMTFDEFHQYLKVYSKKADYPDINN
jgi:hypothetical protein|tara:strand:- start:663 stop:887 length:225 start_codon:yes stop_codon:yes gene_type:complete